MTIAVVLFWISLVAVIWTHVGYPGTMMLLAHFSTRPVLVGDELPSVTVVIAAHNEESVIERRLQNLL